MGYGGTMYFRKRGTAFALALCITTGIYVRICRFHKSKIVNCGSIEVYLGLDSIK